MPERGSRGFTLIEMLAALFVVAFVFTTVSNMLGDSVARMALTREQQETTRLGEQKMRELLASAESGSLPNVGIEEGVFEREFEDDVGYAYRLDVEPYTLPPPEGVDRKRLEGSGLFGRQPSQGAQDEGPALRRVVLRVYREDESPEDAEPFVALLTKPPEQVPGTGPGPGGEQLGEELPGDTPPNLQELQERLRGLAQ